MMRDIHTFKLYEIANDYEMAIDKLLAADEVDEKFREEVLEEIKDTFELKTLNVAKYIKNLEAEHEAVKEAADKLTTRAKRILKRKETLEAYVKFNIERTGLLDPIKSPELIVKLANNPPKVVIFDESLIPDTYKIVKESVSFDKIAIKKDIESGFDVDGAKVERGKRLVIE